MSAPRSLAALAERAALAALAQRGSAALVALVEAAETRAANRTFSRLNEGLALDQAEAALILLLLAHGSSEAVARQIAAASPAAGGRGVPLWLALQLIPGLESGHLAAGRALRLFELVGAEEQAVRIEALLRLDEAVLDRLSDQPPRAASLASRIKPLGRSADFADPRIEGELRRALKERDAGGRSPVVMVERAEPAAAAASLAALGLKPALIEASAIPAEPTECDRLARVWSREALIDGAALIIAAEDGAEARIGAFAERVMGHVMVCGACNPRRLTRGQRFVPSDARSGAALTGRWAQTLGGERAARLGRHLAGIANQFHLSGAEIDAVCAREAAAIDAASDAKAAGRVLWHAAGRIAQAIAVPGVAVIEPAYGWDDIVLSPPVEGALRRLESHVRHAATVMDEWGFAAKMGGRGRGVAALLSGPSGTGKTMAAEVLASALDLRMMVIDLSQIISKYVGETSKNIAACFDHAERSGAVMVWNEGDAVWGARGQVGTATDRHVNSEIGDLLQRIENFRGFTVVTTNMRHAVDPAFLRRFRFMIDFPLPTEAERLRLWQKAFPANAPVDQVDWTVLAGLPLSGGSIRNVALGSAFLAAEAGGRIEAQLIAAELAEELRKQDLPMPVLDWGTRH